MRRIIVAFVLFLSLAVHVALAQADCPAVVESALQRTADLCVNAGRNQACYGNARLEATPREGVSVTFAQAGDVVNVADVQSLRLSPMSAPDWGIALLRLQANLPDSLPGQNVTVLLFGDVTLENGVEPAVTLTAAVSSRARLRSSPSSANDGNVLAGVDAGSTFMAFGRTDAGDWLRVDGEAGTGWISATVVTLDGDAGALAVVDVNAPPPLRPMQAFYFTAGVSDSPCEQAPDSGILIHTPQGQVTMTINGVGVSMGSTIYFTRRDDNGTPTLRAEVYEGTLVLSTPQGAQYVPAGASSTIPLTSDARAPSGAPTPPQPYDAVRLTQFAAMIPAMNTLTSAGVSASAAPGAGGAVTTSGSAPIVQQQPLAADDLAAATGIASADLLDGDWAITGVITQIDGGDRCVNDFGGTVFRLGVVRRYDDAALTLDGDQLTFGFGGSTFQRTGDGWVYEAGNPATADVGGSDGSTYSDANFYMRLEFTSPYTMTGIEINAYGVPPDGFVPGQPLQGEYTWCDATLQLSGVRVQ